MSSARKVLGELEKLETFIGKLDGLAQRRLQRRRDDALGVLPMQEVRPGVYAVTTARRVPRILREAHELLEDLAELEGREAK